VIRRAVAAGEFFYSGTPAAGNLIASNTPAAGTDQYGNIYLANISSYGAGFASSLGGGFSTLYTGSLAGGWTPQATIETGVSGGLFLTGNRGTEMRPGITSIPYRDWPLRARVVERLYRWTHHGQIRTLVVRNHNFSIMLPFEFKETEQG
jgi:hypothetical protein